MSEVRRAGLFPLSLQSYGAPGAPTVSLQLIVYTPKQQVTGLAEVTQATNPPLDLKSHVNGNLIYETVMGPGSKIRIDLSGWAEIVPIDSDIVIPENFSAIVVLEPDYSTGTISYQYRKDFSGAWTHIEQKIKITPLAKAAA